MYLNTWKLLDVTLRRGCYTLSGRKVHLAAAEVRRVFIDYFRERDHKFVRSSPVIPRKDKTLAFVNAGMNQFKPIFTGEEAAPWPRAVNSQKCVRVGGKHNDLSDVGVDGYHHTFFEMLGNWSFGDYFKREACEMAWRLMTEEYGLDPRHLYVTYYAGDPALGVPTDTECREIWRQIGVPEHHILPFRADNFWEMGPVGPCGPCTELHYDHLQRAEGAQCRVNAGHDDVTELWNLVFMQYLRQADGSVTSLPEQHVDTGMGLERLTAVLQGKRDNYATDLFTPLFSTIYRWSPAPEYGGRYGGADVTGLDAAYRTLADHGRMVTATLADGAVPADNQKLRRVLRRALHLAEHTFYSPQLLQRLCSHVADMLGTAFPEMRLRLSSVQAALAAEREAWLSALSAAAGEQRRWAAELPELRQLSVSGGECPGLVEGLRELRRQLPPGRQGEAAGRLTGELALKLHTQHGLSEEVLQEVALVRGLLFDVEQFQSCLSAVRESSRIPPPPANQHLATARLLQRQNLPPTDDSAKYKYDRLPSGEYTFPTLSSRVLAVLNSHGEPVETVSSGEECTVVLDRTCFYSEGGGQVGDRGSLSWPEGQCEVTDTQICRSYTLHRCRVGAGSLSPGCDVTCSVDADWRLACMRHHTATHLLNAALQRVLEATGQTSSHVDPEHLRLEVASFQGALTLEQVAECERLVADWIGAGLPVVCADRPLEQVLELDDVTLLAGEVYPDPVRLVRIAGVSAEPCCGTHLLSTADLTQFRVTAQRAAGLGVRALRAAAGPAAAQAQQAGDAALEALEAMKRGDNTVSEVRALAEAAPYREKLLLIKEIERVGEESKAEGRGRDVSEMVSRLGALEGERACQFVVHRFPGARPYAVSAVRLLRGRTLPTAVLYRSRGLLCLRCCLPNTDVAEPGFSASGWLEAVSSELSELADTDSGVRCVAVTWGDPATTAGLDISGQLSKTQEEAIAERLTARIRAALR